MFVIVEEFGNFLRILTMAGHTEMECFKSQIEKEGIHGSGNAAKVAHQLSNELGRKGHLSESLCVCQAVVGVVGGAKAGVFVGMGVPVEIAAVHNNSANLGGVAVHIFGGGVDNYVAAPFKGPAIDGRGKGVVYDEGYAVVVSNAGELFNVEHVAARVGNGLAKEQAGVGTEGLLYFFFACVGVDKSALDTEFFQSHAKQVVGAAINLITGDKMVSCLADIKNSIEIL